MSEIKENYPMECTDKEIKKFIKGYSKDIYESRANINTVLALSPLVQIGLQELQGRENKRITWFSLGVSFMSLLVSAVALYVTLQ